MTVDNVAYFYTFIHNAYGHFFRNLLDWFADSLHTRYNSRMIGTYDKAVEYINKKCEHNGREQDMPMVPAIILNPLGDFGPDETNSGAKQHWRYPFLMSKMNKRLFNPLYQDEHVQVYVSFARMKGQIEVISLLPSFYEYTDLRMLFLLTFGGFNRYIEPIYFDSFIIIPPDIFEYEYTNDVTGVHYILNWKDYVVTEIIPTTNRSEHVYHGKLKPMIKLIDLADASERYGGADGLPDWRLTATLEYEIELPSYMVLESDYLVKDVSVNVFTDSVYSSNERFVPPDRVWTTRRLVNTNLDSTSITIVDQVEMTDVEVTTSEMEYLARFYHIVTQSDVDSTSVQIYIPMSITNLRIVKVVGKNGEFDYYTDYILYPSTSPVSTEMILYNNDTTALEKDDIIEIYIYQVVSIGVV